MPHLSNTIRVIEIDGEPWFVAADVRNTLKLQRGGRKRSNMRPDEERVISELNGVTLKRHGLSLVSEIGL